MNKNDAKAFLDNYLAGIASSAQHDQFIQWLQQAAPDDIAFIIEYYQSRAATNAAFPAPAGLMENIESALDRTSATPKGRIFYLFRYRAVVAASLLLISLGIIAYLSNREKKAAPGVGLVKNLQKEIAAPALSRAVLTLASGQQIVLEQVKNRQTIQANNISLARSAEGQYKYGATTALSAPAGFNVLRNPRGSKVVSLTLDDGTKVWLNSESSLRFPVSFDKENRSVEITGEAYFEVAHEPSRPFIVKSNETSIRVLGTHFNVNAYRDVAGDCITLLEGRVQVALDAQNQLVLLPGQQALTTGKSIERKTGIDLTQVIGWQRGMFEFDNTPVPLVLKQIERWYDVTVDYNGRKDFEKIGGGISRNLPLSKIIELLNANGIPCRLDGRIIRLG